MLMLMMLMLTLLMAMMMKMLKMIVTFDEAHMDHVSVLMLSMTGTVMRVTIMSMRVMVQTMMLILAWSFHFLVGKLSGNCAEVLTPPILLPLRSSLLPKIFGNCLGHYEGGFKVCMFRVAGVRVFVCVCAS